LQRARERFVELRALENERWEYVLAMGYHIPSPGYGVKALWRADTKKNLIGEIVARHKEPRLVELTHAILFLRNALVVAHQPMITKIIRKKVRKELGILGFDDLQAHGTLGLMVAVDRFDVDRGLQFSTYAGLWIKSYLFRAVHDLGATVRMPAHKPGLANVVSLGQEYADDFRIVDTLAVSEPEQLDHYSGISGSEVRGAQERLSPRLRCVIEERFYHGKTLSAIGAKNGLSRERIRQLERDALVQLRRELGVVV
jgi:RNA polymerase sigma factor (sigma-70 family)